MKGKAFKSKIFLSFFSVISITLICCLLLPTSAFSLTADDIPALADGKHYYYVDGNENDQWVLTNGEWKHCDIVDNSENLCAVTDMVRKEMIKRNTDIALYIATKADGYNEKLDPSDPNYTADSDVLSTKSIEKIFNRINTDVYKTDGIIDREEKAKSGIYLDMLTLSVTSTNESGRVIASDMGDYSYYKLVLEVKYSTTAQMENKVDAFAKQWQKAFIDENPVIQNPALNINEKNYYITKTIYNYLSDNTIYDRNVKENTGGGFGPETEQYKNSHSAYGAIFGNTVDGSGSLDTSLYDYTVYTDSMGLTRIKKTNQGLSVCDGYSLLTYYLCQLNGIDCDIVNGDYDEESDMGSDPHAWNIVYLCPSDSDTYTSSQGKWYFFDGTYSATSPISVKLDAINIVDYNYFLRGTSNRAFDSKSHQQITSAVSGIDENDYRFNSSSIDCSDAWVVLTRRIDADDYLKVENYFLISPDLKYYKIDEKTFELIECDKNIVYDGNSYYYNMNIQDFVNGIEYSCSDRYFKDSGEYSFKAVSVDGSKDLYTLNFNISTLDMSSWDGYQHLMWGDGATTKDLINTDLSHSAYVEFRGASISFTVEIQDVAGQKLTEGVNYIIVYKNGRDEIISAACLPDEYKIEIDFDQNTADNYSGKLIIPFTITKGNFANFSTTPIDNITFGADILAGCGSLNLSNAGVELKNGVDYTVALMDSNRVNFGDEGTIIYTALPTSNYLISGTVLYRSYKMSQQLDLSSFNGSTITNYRYPYTGNPVTPNDFTLTVIINGTPYTLILNRDYVITSYRNNINAGTGYVTVQFIGNFCGLAEMGFQIYMPEQGNPSNPSDSSNQQPSNGQGNQQPQVSITVQNNFTYNGTAQTPSATVTVNGVALTQGVHYSVSSVPSGAGVYECTVQGLGQYSYISYKTAVFVNPAKVTGGSTKASSASTVTISWNGQGDKCYYEVYTYDAKKKKWVLVAKTKATTYKTNYYVNNGKKTQLKGNTQYKFRVRAYYSASVNGTVYTKYGDYTSINGVTKISAPASPKANKGKNSFKLSWKKVSNASGYEIVYATDSKFKKNKKVCNITKGKTTSATIKKLKAGKTYYVKIRAYQKVNGKKIYSSYTKAVKVKV
ncbi:MAG: fibronectin type III domain-containing protein [Eubacterium sp.]